MPNILQLVLYKALQYKDLLPFLSPKSRFLFFISSQTQYLSMTVCLKRQQDINRCYVVLGKCNSLIHHFSGGKTHGNNQQINMSFE